MNPDCFYIYALCYLDGTPFYIGCTSDLDKRYRQHWTDRLHPEKADKNAIIATMASVNQRPLLQILDYADNKEDGQTIEAFYIASFKGLTNTYSNVHKHGWRFPWSQGVAEAGGQIRATQPILQGLIFQL